MNFGIPALVLGGFAFLLEVIGLAIPYWLYYGSVQDGVGSVSVNAGLWRGCQYSPGFALCSSVDDIGLRVSSSAALDASRGMVVISVILLFGALSCLGLKLFVMKQETRLPKVAGIVAIVGGVFGIIGCIIFAAKFGNYNYVGFILKLHAAFGLCIVASVMGIVSGALSFLIRDN